MYGAILGDIIGSPFEFDMGEKSKEFPLFSAKSAFTDDTVMTIAVGEALLDAGKDADVSDIREKVIASMRKWGQKYPHAGYGGRFNGWLHSPNPKPYGSYGNGSAMRVSAAGWLYPTLERTREVARATAEVTHNHPEGMKGAEAVASIIFLARNGNDKDAIKAFVQKEFGYALNRTIDEIRPSYQHVESCQETVPEAITAFLEGSSFEDVIRTAVSLGGDCDTLTDIATAMAEAFYGIPVVLQAEVRERLTPEMLAVLQRFDEALGREQETRDPFLVGNEIIEQAIDQFYQDTSEENFGSLMYAIHTRMCQNGHLILPTRMDDDVLAQINLEAANEGDTFTEEKERSFEMCTVQAPNKKLWMAAFTSEAEYHKGERVNAVFSQFIDWIMDATLQNPAVEGIAINPWGKAVQLPKDIIEKLMKAHHACR